MPIQFKFRGERSFRALLNVVIPCTVQRVKAAIFEQARISDSGTDLSLEDAATGEPVNPRVLLTADTLVQLIVRRIPLQPQQDGGGAPGNSGTVALALATVGGTLGDSIQAEEDMAIERVVEAHDLGALGLSAGPGGEAPGAGVRYSRSYQLAASSKKKREGYEGSDDEDVFEVAEPPPPDYTCHRCGMTGGKPESHWIWECPTNDIPDHTRKVRTARGVPRAFLQKVASIEEGQELSAGGVTFTIPGHSGHYIIAHQDASLEEKKLRLGDTVQEKVAVAFTEGAKNVEESLKCPLCNQMFRQATLAPCCGATFCSDCIVDRLAHSSVDDCSCPSCGKEVLAHQLVANLDIRSQVEKITQSSKSAAIALQKERGQREAAEARRPLGHQPLALEDDWNGGSKRRRKEEPGAALALGDVPTGGGSSPSPAPAVPAARKPLVVWPPLGFGPRLTEPQFATWQRMLAGAEVVPALREQFAECQRQLRWARAPPPPPPVHFTPPHLAPPHLAPPHFAAPQPAPAQHLAPAPAPAMHSRESFEAWQRSMRGSRR